MGPEYRSGTEQKYGTERVIVELVDKALQLWRSLSMLVGPDRTSPSELCIVHTPAHVDDG